MATKATEQWAKAYEARTRREGERVAIRLMREEQDNAYRQEQAEAAALAKAMREAKQEDYRRGHPNKRPLEDRELRRKIAALKARIKSPPASIPTK